MSEMPITSDNLKARLRPLVEDAAASLEYGGYIADEKVALDWYDGLTVEGVQEVMMYAIQRGVLSGLGIAPLPDMDGVPTIEED